MKFYNWKTHFESFPAKRQNRHLDKDRMGCFLRWFNTQVQHGKRKIRSCCSLMFSTSCWYLHPFSDRPKHAQTTSMPPAPDPQPSTRLNPVPSYLPLSVPSYVTPFFKPLRKSPFVCFLDCFMVLNSIYVNNMSEKMIEPNFYISIRPIII